MVPQQPNAFPTDNPTQAGFARGFDQLVPETLVIPFQVVVLHVHSGDYSRAWWACGCVMGLSAIGRPFALVPLRRAFIGWGARHGKRRGAVVPFPRVPGSPDGGKECHPRMASKRMPAATSKPDLVPLSLTAHIHRETLSDGRGALGRWAFLSGSIDALIPLRDTPNPSVDLVVGIDAHAAGHSLRFKSGDSVPFPSLGFKSLGGNAGVDVTLAPVLWHLSPGLGMRFRTFRLDRRLTLITSMFLELQLRR